MLSDGKMQHTRHLLVLLIAVCAAVGATSVLAQGEPQVQVTRGIIEPGQVMQYELTGLEQGDTLYVYARHTSGNLNPLLALSDADIELAALQEVYLPEYEALIQQGVGPIEAQDRALRGLFLAFDDNGGVDSDAAFEYKLAKDGDYRLLLGSTLTKETFGTYELQIGINAPLVLTGETHSTTDEIAVLDEEASGIASAVQEITGTLTLDNPQTFFTLNDVGAGETLYAHIEVTSGDLIPIIKLTDYGGAVLRNPNGVLQQPSAALEYVFDDDATNYRLDITSCCEGGDLGEGDFRLLVGIDEPTVLTGQAQPHGAQVFTGPTLVSIGVKLQQITGVDQVAENYGVVAQVQMEWNDPQQAFNPDSCRCSFKTYTDSSLTKLLTDSATIWPDFTIFNQQGNRWTQNKAMVSLENGDALFLERFSATLQAPDFNFKAFPFDSQLFTLKIDSLYPDEFFTYVDLANLTEVGDQLGEEEWIITDSGTEVATEDGSSRYTFWFTAERHVNFYLIRIIIPTLLIVIVSWFTFFLKDYGKRVDVTLANLFVFVAFSFTVSGDLPRLGYLTFLDAFLAGTFIITALVLIFNVVLRRLEVIGKHNWATRMDNFTIWMYPVGYVAFCLWLYGYFLS